MNVTKENLGEVAAEIEALLPTVSFVAIDEEMTGISVEGQKEQIQDWPARRYSKMRTVASRYNIIQVGVCLFHETESGGGYVARPYNFYLFPDAGTITMEGSSINFLRTHNMDFNKWIYEGVPYLTSDGLKKVYSSLFPEEKKTDSGGKEKQLVLTRESDIALTNSALAKIREWLYDESRKDETELEVLTTNAFIRKFMYEAVAKEFPELVTESRPVPGPRPSSTFVVLRLDEAQKAEHAARIRAEKEQEYTQRAGFSRVFKALCTAKKPLIGHNCMYDMLFLMSHLNGPLPKSYETFRETFLNYFPLVLDTKLLVSREPFKFKPQAKIENGQPPPAPEPRFGSTALGEIFAVFQEEVTAAKEAGRPVVDVSFAPSFDRYANDVSAAHEAAYDAYMTGFAFAQMAKEALKPEAVIVLGNRLPMFRGLFEFSLAGGSESKLHGSAYVHVSGLTGLAVSDVKAAFAEVKIPGEESPAHVVVHWIDDDSAFAVFPEVCKEALVEKLERSKSDGCLKFTHGEEWFAAQSGKEVGGPEEQGTEEPAAKRART